ncbi:uncharacterized protein VDAG_04687 [Verticillium dahliae VdLs.17]|uniref:Zn(2)-C6 fungal-type domain-containing protein n=1 Tax=Verticillium dahliae (strain VdLs.17 / ATCC MYA-4575 / FGSC 10137) TaxID=498257 RepID=G2X3V0_VERDV|nr:uncharacterized protein VDAG_04687 [Verticillium dahliae VdLs.17]EGY23249.1 hypothetical protein VDAG_04687 [Verticillium dahliae VdLs.17]
MPGDAVTDWLSFDAQQPKKRRAELVCFGCHNKKIKCDLQVRKRHGHDNCTHCATADKQCQTRPSKRIKRRHAAPVTPAHKSPKPPTPSVSVPPIVEMPENVPQVPQGPQEPQGPEDGHHHRLDDLAAAASLPIFDTIHVSPPDPDVAATDPGHRETSVHLPRRTSTHHFFAPPQQVLSPSQRSAASTTRSDALAQSQSQTGDVDTGFLQVFGPENQHDAEKQAIEASFEPKAGFPSLRQQDLQESFIDTYWEYCYTWCPVLDRDCLPEEMAQSPLLANALATAASHVQPPLLPHEGPAEYYRRAKALFYDDEELDGITSIKSIALFYWWAPRPPTVTHRHSSWWWTSVLIRHAQQMNIHREPSASQTTLSAQDMSLRRRIWWTAFELVNWVNSLPPHLQLPIGAARTYAFDKDVHQLHLPYLTTIIILYMKRSAQTIPEALPPAILAASCIVRILKDILNRGNVRFLMAITCWYTGTAFIALQQARSIEHLARDADQGLDVLVRTADQLQNMWASANVIRQGFQRMLNGSNLSAKHGMPRQAPDLTAPVQAVGNAASHASFMGVDALRGPASTEAIPEYFGDFDWTALFPFVTRETSSIADSLLKNKAEGNETRGFPSPTNFLFHDSLMIQYDDLFDTAADFGMNFTMPQ